jgi:hypothetical protein
VEDSRMRRSEKPGHLAGPIDRPIAALVRSLRSVPWMTTLGSCCGHEREGGYVDLAVKGPEGVRQLVRLMNLVDRAQPSALLEIGLNWSEEVATACHFEAWPDWVMFSLKIGDDEFVPTNRDLALLARAFKAALGKVPPVLEGAVPGSSGRPASGSKGGASTSEKPRTRARDRKAKVPAVLTPT